MTRRSRFSSSRSLLLLAAVTVGSVVALAEPRAASACAPQQNIPNVFLAPRASLGGGPLSVPKSAGLLFQAQLNTRTEAAAKAMVSIEVRSGDTVIPGTLETVGTVVGPYAWWRWLPDGESELPLGPLAIKITVSGGSQQEDAVTVDDRSIAPLTPTFSVSATRQLKADASAPKITCRDQLAGGSCGGDQPRQVSTRAVAEAAVSVALSANEQDAPYFQPTVHILGRRSGSADTVRESVAWGTAFGQFEGQFDEFCAQVTTRSLIDGTETTTDTTCIQNTLDLGPVSESDQASFVKQKLGSCSNAEYPPGTSADNPTGVATGTEQDMTSPPKAYDSGCSIGTKARPANAFVVAFAIGLCALANRRSRRVATSR